MNTNGIKSGIRLSLLVIGLVLFLDQALKIWIKTTMTLDQEIPIFGDWFILHFTENNGMAFGLEFGGEYGKLFLTLFRILAVIGLGYYLYLQIKEGAKTGFIICLSMITAGAAGNILDSLFYGHFFTASNHYEVATAFPEEGYAPFFYGKVVDMLYMPVFKGFLPEWLGGDYFIFFRPIFNLADASISLGVFFILIFQRSFFAKSKVEVVQEEGSTLEGELGEPGMEEEEKGSKPASAQDNHNN